MSPWPGNRTKRPSVSAESPKELSGCLSGPLPSGHHSVLPLRHHVQVLHTLGQHGKESSPDQGNRFFRDGIIVSMYKQIAAVQRLQPAINIVDESCIESLPDGFTGTVDAVTVLGQFILQRLSAKQIHQSAPVRPFPAHCIPAARRRGSTGKKPYSDFEAFISSAGYRSSFYIAQDLMKEPLPGLFHQRNPYIWIAIPSEASMDSWMASERVGWAKMVAWMSSSVSSA